LNSLKRNFNSAGKPKSGGAHQVNNQITDEKANWQTDHAVYKKLVKKHGDAVFSAEI